MSCQDNVHKRKRNKKICNNSIKLKDGHHWGKAQLSKVKNCLEEYCSKGNQIMQGLMRNQ